MNDNRYLKRLISNLDQDGSATFCRMVGTKGATTLTWADFRRDCCRFRDAYRQAGLLPGDLVLIFLRHVPELYGSFFGAPLGGFVPSFMPCASPRQDPKVYWSSHNELMQRIKPAAVVASEETFKEMADAGFDIGAARKIVLEDVRTTNPAMEIDISDVGEETVGLLQHSSGTTGLKKGVALSFGAIANQLDSYGQSLNLTKDDVIVSWLPLYHDMGLIACCILPVYFNIPIVHIDAFHWIGRPSSLFDEVQRNKGTLSWMPNFAYEHMTNLLARRASTYDLSSLRAVINCSEPCKASTFDRFTDGFAAAGLAKEVPQCCYAMAESVFAVTQTDIGQLPRRVRIDPESLARGRQLAFVESGGVELIACGKCIDGIDVKVVDEDRREIVQQPAVGELALSGQFMFSGYNKEPEKTAQQLDNGVYFTRDLGFVYDGHVFVLGRLDDMIIINGRNIYAHEVESVISNVEGAKSGRNLAAPLFDEKVGSNTLLIIAEKEPELDIDEEKIRRGIMDAIHSTFNVTPHKIRLVDTGWLIKTTSGKISRSANLRKYIAESAGGPNV